MRRNMFVALSAVAVFLATVISGSALAKDAAPIQLTYGTPFAAEHPFSQIDQRWIAKIEKDTNGRVKIKPYWGGQIIGGANQVEEIAGGAADIGFVQPSASKSGFDLCKAIMIYFGGSDVQTGLRVWKEVRAKFPEIDKEYTDAGVKPMQWACANQELMTRKPVRKTTDLKGMRLKAIGDWSKVFKAFGAEGLAVSQSEMYTQIQKGILDGNLGLIEGLESLKFSDVTKYVSMYDFLVSPFANRAMNLAKYNSLPPDIRKIFDDSVEYWTQDYVKTIAAVNAHGMEFGKKAGVEFITISAQDKAQAYGVMNQVAAAEAKALDAKGLRGTQLLNEIQRLIKQYSAK